jgi:hydroxymethylglutaryl-CoA lyase
MNLPARVTMREVGTRDGIQSLGAFVPTEQKIEMANLLAQTGLTRIEVTSFVSPKAVPQLADAEQVMAGIERPAGVSWEVLVPNVRGAERALATRPDQLLVVLAASDAFNLKNIRMTIDDSLASIRQIIPMARSGGLPVIAAISTSFGCPYAGDVPEAQLHRVIGELLAAGADEISIADTTGMANPLQVERTVGNVLDRWPDGRFGLHFHNTRGMGLANVVAGLRAGVTIYDASVGGIGGCPFGDRQRLD